MPPWAITSQYIHTGYRDINHSVRGAIGTIWQRHNETGNIASHLFASWVFLLLLLQDTLYHGENAINWLAVLFSAVVSVTFSLSAFYHVILCTNEATVCKCFVIDLIGVCLHSWISGFVFLYSYVDIFGYIYIAYTIYCFAIIYVLVYKPNLLILGDLHQVYICGIGICLFIAAIPYISLNDGLILFVIGIATDCVGMLIKYTAFPERIYSIRYDTNYYGCFSSHAIWHMFVFIGTFWIYLFVISRPTLL